MTSAKIFFSAAALLACLSACSLHSDDEAADRRALEKTTKAIRDAFARGDVAAIIALHRPDVIKYFGGSNVVIGRDALAKGLTDMFRSQKMEFIENKVESSVITGNTAIEVSIFALKITPKNGGQPTIATGRSMVVYIRDNESPTGWASLREMAQAAPDQ